MKAGVYDQVRLLVDVAPCASDREVIPAGTLGTVVESYDGPEGYSVDVAIPDEDAVTGYDYDNVVVGPEAFVVVMRYVEPGSGRASAG